MLLQYTEDPATGEISFFIAEGTGNRITFEDFVKTINEQFDLGLNPGYYNYIIYCH